MNQQSGVAFSQDQNIQSSTEFKPSGHKHQTGWKGIQGSMVASALMGSMTTNDTAMQDQMQSARELTQEDSSPKAGQSDHYQGMRGQKRKRGLTATLSMRSPPTSHRMSQDVGKELTCKKVGGLQSMRNGKFSKPSVGNEAMMSPNEKQKKTQAFASSRFFRGATATQLDKDKYSQFKAKKKIEPPRLGYLFKVKQLPTTEFLKLRHDERLRESEFAAQEPHNQRQRQEYLNLKNANVNTNKDKCVLIARPQTGTLDSTSIQTQHMKAQTPSRGASRSNINNSGLVARAGGRKSRNLDRLYATTGVRTSGTHKLGTAKSQTAKSTPGQRMYSTINNSAKRLEGDHNDFGDDLSAMNPRTQLGRRTKPHQHMGINVEMASHGNQQSAGRLIKTSKNKLVDQLFLCKKPADPDYRKTAAGKTNTSSQITSKIKHFQSFKYPPSSPEGKEFMHLSKNPLKLSNYERNYTKTEKRQPRNRYYEKASQDDAFSPTDTVQGMLTQKNNQGNYATIQFMDRDGKIQNSTPPPNDDNQDYQMIYIADPKQQKRKSSKLSNKMDQFGEYEQAQEDGQKNKTMSYDFQGYTDWFSKQVDRMVASDNIAYKCRDEKKYIFQQIKDSCKMKYCQQKLNVGGIQMAGPSLGSPLRYLKKQMPQGRYPEKWGRMTSASRYFQTAKNTTESLDSSNHVISGVQELSGLQEKGPKYFTKN